MRKSDEGTIESANLMDENKSQMTHFWHECELLVPVSCLLQQASATLGLLPQETGRSRGDCSGTILIQGTSQDFPNNICFSLQ